MLRCEHTMDAIVSVQDGVTTVQQWEMASLYGYDRLECFAGWHAGTGSLAIAVLVLYGVGFPVCSYVHVRAWLHAVQQEQKQQPGKASDGSQPQAAAEIKPSPAVQAFNR